MSHFISQSLGEFLTQWSVRFAVACYLVRLAGDVVSVRSTSRGATLVQLTWTLGLLFFLLHVWCAFEYFHQGSHAAAYAHTARRTAETVGLEWGGGLYVNYLLTLWWTLDVVASWQRFGQSFVRRRLYLWTLHLFFGFMVFNATIVFGPPGWRWFGLGATIGGALAWLRYSKRNSDSRGP